MKKNYITLKSIAFINKVFILFILISISNNLYAQNSDCSAKLGVVNNQTSKTSGEYGTFYKLRLTNTGNERTTYYLSTKNVGTANSLAKDELDKNEIKMNSQFYTRSSKKLENKINSDSENVFLLTLESGEVSGFLVKFRFPPNTKIGSKNKSKVKVTTEKCKNFSVDTVLETTFVGGE